MSNAPANVIPFIANALRQRERATGLLEADIVEGLRQAKAAQGARYRDVQRDLHFFAGDAFSDHMQKLVQRLYARKAERWNTDFAYHRYLNVVAMQQRTLAVMAHQTPSTHLVDAAGARLPEDDPNVMLWRKDERDLRFGSVIKSIDRDTVLHRTLVVQAAWVKGRMRWLRHMPQNVRIVQDIDDPTRLPDAPVISVGLANTHDSAQAEPALWSTWIVDPDGLRRHYLHDANGALYEETLTPDKSGLNPYRMHPFAVWHDGEPAEGEFFLPPRESWWSEQRWINRAMMGLAHTMDFQTFAVPWLKHWAGEDPSPTISPDEPIVTQGDRASFSFVTADTNVEEMEGIIENALRRTAVSEGMPPDMWSIDLAARSMAALKLGRQHLNERREDRVSDYGYFIDETWQAHVAVANYHRPQQKYADGVRLVVEWQPIPLPVDRFQEAQARTLDYQSGLSNPIDDIMRRDRVDRDEATERHRRNLVIVAGGSETDQTVEVREDDVLNGGQLKSASDIVLAVAAGQIPRDAGLGQLFVLFNLSKEQSETIMGSAGTGTFSPPAPGDGKLPKPKGTPPAPAHAPGQKRPPDAS